LKSHQLNGIGSETVAELELTIPKDSHYDQVVSEPGKYYCGDDLVLILDKLPSGAPDILHSLKNIKYGPEHRTTGNVYRKVNKPPPIGESRVFGYQPRTAISQNFCRLASLGLESPPLHESFISMGQVLSERYRDLATEKYQKQLELVSGSVLPDWIISGTPFTSGIANRNNNLRYHYDSHNMPDVFSVMVMYRKDVDGGLLVIPEYRIAVDIPDSFFILFNGKSLLHGVSKITKKTASAYRFSVVYYSLKAMQACLAPTEELERVRLLKTNAQRKRAEQCAIRGTKLQEGVNSPNDDAKDA
jgi:hypothetical protein